MSTAARFVSRRGNPRAAPSYHPGVAHETRNRARRRRTGGGAPARAAAGELGAALARWQALDLGGALERAGAYLPEGFAIRATVYPVVKRSNQDDVPQGPFYTVGWQMASLVKAKGRQAVVDGVCDPRRLLVAFDEIVRAHPRADGQGFASWPPELLRALGATAPAVGDARGRDEGRDDP